MVISGGCDPRRLQGQDLNLQQAKTKLNVFVFAHPSTPSVRAASPGQTKPHPSTQFVQDLAIGPSNPKPWPWLKAHSVSIKTFYAKYGVLAHALK